MSKTIKNIHTNEGITPIDYESLANLPDIPAIVEQAGYMKKDDTSYARASTQSEVFSSEKEYNIGDYCIYENVLYKFAEAKVAGEWDSTKVTATTIDAELKAHATAISEQNVNLEAISSILNKKELLTVISGSSSFEITRCFSYKNGNHIHAEIRGKVTAKISDATNVPFFYLSGGNIPFSGIYCGTFYSNNITFPGYAYIDTNNKYFKQNAISEISENTVIGFIVDFAI